tara:strand:+ start:2397 stop:3671 length:1275 start_codon:yes stop_codon:yes gene_type:complete
MRKIVCILGFFMMLGAKIAYAKLVTYEFDINTKPVNITGKDVTALAINNQIPGPTIEATYGDTLQVTFNNKMDTEASVHWHGILLPNNQDGVPYLTTQPIAPHASLTYRYNIAQHGTYWYHSHTGLQKQRGIYGALVFHPKKVERIGSDKDYIAVFSDWTNENPNQVLANIKKDGDYYALKKDSVQSWEAVIRNGSEAIRNRLQGSWSRMGTMDLSDVGYDAFLTNGKREQSLAAHKGDRVRARLINASASTYLNVEYAGGPMTIVAADGVDVEPIQVQRLRIAAAETYDVIVHIPSNKAYELRATARDGTGYTSTFIGNGTKVFSPDIPKPNVFLMHNLPNHNDGSQNKPVGTPPMTMGKAISQDTLHNTKSSRQKNTGNVVAYMANYDNLRAIKDTSFDKHKARREVVLNLTGNMTQYNLEF